MSTEDTVMNIELDPSRIHTIIGTYNSRELEFVTANGIIENVITFKSVKNEIKENVVIANIRKAGIHWVLFQYIFMPEDFDKEV